MYHYFNAITNKAGDALVGYFVRALDSNGDAVSIYADENATPIVSVSGIADMAKVDANGNASFYIESGTYDLAIYAPDSTTLYLTVRDLPMQVLGVSSFKEAVRAATTAAGTLASDFENGDTIDGVVLATGDRILVKNQADATENGIYLVAASGAPARTEDADTSADLIGAAVVVSEGTANAQKMYVSDADATFALDTDALGWGFPSGGGDLLSTNNLSDLDDASTARSNLGLGTMATQASGSFLSVSNNLSDLNNASTARTNLGIDKQNLALPLTFNFSDEAEALFYADEAMTLTQQATSGTLTIAYEKSTAAAPSTFSSTSSPVTLEAGAWLKVGATNIIAPAAVHLKRT